MKLRAAFFILTVLLFSYSCAFADTPVFLPNSGFEEGSGLDAYFWTKWVWDKGPGVTEFIWDSEQKHSGLRSACIISNSPNDARYMQEIITKGNTYYKLSCWIKTENVGLNAKGANLSIDGLLDTSRDIKGTSNTWEYVELYGKTAPNQQSFTLTVGLGGYSSLNTGKAWFDDISVEEITSPPPDRNVINLSRDSLTGNTSERGKKYSWLIVVALLSILLASFLFSAWKFLSNEKPESAMKSPVGTNFSQPAVPVKTDRKDIAIMSSMTVVYLIIALINLGSFNVPKTSWKAAKPGESFIIDLGRDVNVSRIYYYMGLTERKYEGSKYRLEYYDNSANAFYPLTSIEVNDFYKWKYIAVNAKTKLIKVTADTPGGELKEIGIFEGNDKKPVSGITILEKKTDAADAGIVENLFDEQDKIEYSPSFMTSTYFDEIYHARTAYEHLIRVEPYETTHPPLGKIFIAIGIALFGMNTFGWRIVGTLFGAAMIPAIYLFGKKIFKQRFYAFCAAFLMMFDFMHFAQTRIATIDVYSTFFVILMYYFMYDYYVNKSYVLGFKQSLKPLFFCGLFFGIGAACKWVSIYAGGGLALLFLLVKHDEYRDYVKLAKGKSVKKMPAWVKEFMPDYVIKTLLYCMLFFVIVPLAIYILSYIPFMMVPGPGHDLAGVLRNQIHMFNYHSTLKATHSFSSFWWEWPIMRKPIWYYSGTDVSPGNVSSIVSFGNPAVWWAGIPATIMAAVIAVRKRDRKMTVIFTAMAFQYLPWILVTRLVFIYHFFSTVPFMIIAIVYVIKYLTEKYPYFKYTAYVYLGTVFILFVIFYPVLSGMEVPKWYVDNLKWFKSWIF